MTAVPPPVPPEIVEKAAKALHSVEGDPLCEDCWGDATTVLAAVYGDIVEAARRDDPCPTCQGRNRATTDMVCMTCGRDYLPDDGSDVSAPGLGWLRLLGLWREQAKQMESERDAALADRDRAVEAARRDALTEAAEAIEADRSRYRPETELDEAWLDGMDQGVRIVTDLRDATAPPRTPTASVSDQGADPRTPGTDGAQIAAEPVFPSWVMQAMDDHQQRAETRMRRLLDEEPTDD